MSSRLVRGNVEALIAPVVWSTVRPHAPVEKTPPREDPTPNRDFEREAEQRIAEARRLGVREGRAAAQQEYETQVQPLTDRLEEIISAFGASQGGTVREKEERLVELAIAVSRRIVHRELSVDPEAVRALVQAALDRLESRELRRIRTCPAHLNFVRSVLERMRPGQNVELIADETLRPGSLLFETEHGDLDASVDSQLEEIRRGLADRL